jgi:hypothetical protein
MAAFPHTVKAVVHVYKEFNRDRDLWRGKYAAVPDDRPNNIADVMPATRVRLLLPCNRQQIKNKRLLCT